jgi:hypothetical protein
MRAERTTGQIGAMQESEIQVAAAASLVAPRVGACSIHAASPRQLWTWWQTGQRKDLGSTIAASSESWARWPVGTSSPVVGQLMMILGMQP